MNDCIVTYIAIERLVFSLYCSGMQCRRSDSLCGAQLLWLKKLTDRSTGFVEHSVNRLLKLAFMSVVACIQKIIQLSFVVVDYW